MNDQNITFYKAKSRLGLINKPYLGDEANIGVECAPEAILDPGFINEHYKNSQALEYKFSSPDGIDPANYFVILCKESLEFTDQIQNTIGNSQQVVIGGDHSVAFASILSLSNRYKANEIGIIQFDTHPDQNLRKTSPSGNFHGMVMRTFFRNFDIEPFEKATRNYKFEPNQWLYIGNFEMDPYETEFIRANRISFISGEKLKDRPNEMVERVKTFIKKFRHIHLSFDIDVFVSTLASATGTPNPNGLNKNQVFPLLEIIRDKAKSLSIDLVEVNPRKQKADATVNLAREVSLNLV